MNFTKWQRREVFLLVGPLVLLGAFGVWTSLENQRKRQRASGPLRAVIRDVKVEPATPFEAWQGFDFRVSIDTEVEGEQTLPQGAKLGSKEEVSVAAQLVVGDKIFPIDSRLSLKTDVYEKRVARLCAVYDWHDPKQTGHRTLLVRTRDLKGTHAQLRATVRVTPFAVGQPAALEEPWRKAPFGRLKAPSKPADFEVKVPLEPPVIDQSAPKLKQTQVFKYAPKSNHTGMLLGQGETIAKFQIVPAKPLIKNPIQGNLFQGPAEIVNEKGERMLLPKRANLRASGYTLSWRTNPAAQFERRIPTWQIPKSHGPLFYRTWIAFDESWPVEVKIPVRKAWECQKPEGLTIESVKVEGENVRVRLKYTGPRKLETDEFGVLVDTFQDWERAGVLPNADDQTPVLFNWSQHIEMPNGKQHWFENVVSVESARYVGPELFEVVYRTNVKAALKPGQSAIFRADIGIKGQGFLPVQARISREVSPSD